MRITITPDSNGCIKIVDTLVSRSQWMEAINTCGSRAFGILPYGAIISSYEMRSPKNGPLTESLTLWIMAPHGFVPEGSMSAVQQFGWPPLVPDRPMIWMDGLTIDEAVQKITQGFAEASAMPVSPETREQGGHTVALDGTPLTAERVDETLKRLLEP
ncbi:MAG TPA: hypothetical protein VN519_06855 [Bryobacteraceae bacterium]|nr:hypothetical protein [Bryobacteraceae bacterium]